MRIDRALAWTAAALAGWVFFYAAPSLPPVGDHGTPAAVHVSPRYIEGAKEETATPNMVTAIVADYRGYDTLGETAVIFTAGLACLLILTAPGRKPR